MSRAYRLVFPGKGSNGEAAAGFVVFDGTTQSLRYFADVRRLSVDDTSTRIRAGERGQEGRVVSNAIEDDDDLGGSSFEGTIYPFDGRWDGSDPSNAPISDFAARLGGTPVGSDAPLDFEITEAGFALRAQLEAMASGAGETVRGTNGGTRGSARRPARRSSWSGSAGTIRSSAYAATTA